MNLFYTLKEDASNVVCSFFLFFEKIFACSSDDGIVFAREFHRPCKVYVEIEAENSLRRY